MKPIIAFDPGLTTGMAIISPGGKIVSMREFSYSEIMSGEFKEFSPLDPYVVIERTPVPTLSQLNIKLFDIQIELASSFPRNRVKFVKPTEWKSSRFGLEIIEHDSSHCQDAARLGLFYYSRLMEA